MISSKDSQLLVITSRYPHPKDSMSSSFVKDQVDCIKDYIRKVYVIPLTPFIPKFLSKFSFMTRWRRDAFAKDYKYDNVEVYFAKHLTLPFDFSRKKRGDVSFKVVNKIIKDKNLKFDLIHSHFTYPSGYVGAKLKEQYRVPLIITGHGHDVYDLPFKNAGWNKKIGDILNKADHIITVSKSNYDKLMQLDISNTKISIIPNGYDSNLFKSTSISKSRDKLSLPPDKKIILSVGSLKTVKGHRYLIKAMKRIIQKEKDILCLMVGSGSQLKSLKNLIKELDLNNNIKLLGSKPHNEIPLWMNACDVFVLPSLSEGNPTVMFEALGCGKPFVGTTVGGIPEVITDEKLGILVEPKDVDGLAKAILKALDIEWNKNYIFNYAKQFTWDVIAEKIMEVYDEVIKKDSC